MSRLTMMFKLVNDQSYPVQIADYCMYKRKPVSRDHSIQSALLTLAVKAIPTNIVSS